MGFALDLILGDPQWFPHPVRAIGWLAARAEVWWRATDLPLRFAGALFWITVVGATTVIVKLSGPRANVYWIYSLLACRDLDSQARSVIRALNIGTLDDARKQLSWIVGRDTAHLDEPEIVRAVIETVAENTTDGVIAPLFYLAFGGPVGMAFYKAANTLDSAVGYRNARYRDFGWWSARADDILNFFPARITALLVWAVALLPGFQASKAAQITRRDGASQPSPNAGFPEAAFAGALGIRLGGLNLYHGVPSHKPHLGDSRRPLHRKLYGQTRTLLYGVTGLFVALLCSSPLFRRPSCH